jgi:S1-C subfamily serine protease
MSNVFNKALLSITVLFFAVTANAQDKLPWKQQIAKAWVPSVVSVESRFKNYLNLEQGIGTFNGTGFVVDSENGYIVTNAHVAQTNPALYRLTFYNNETIDAKLKYIDPWMDFAILKYEPAELSFKAKAVILGSHKELSVGDELTLIGNSSSEGISVKDGPIVKLFVNRTSNSLGRYGHYIHTSIARAPGSSGAPLFSKAGRVIGVHALGNGNESFEVRIDYVTDALSQIQNNRIPLRGDIQVALQTKTWSEAQKSALYPKSFVNNGPKENAELHEVIVVAAALAGSKAADVLIEGDIIVGFKTDDEQLQQIGYSLYDFDKVINKNVGKNVKLSIFRRVGNETRTFDVELPVYDANQSFSKRYTEYAGSIFQDISTSLGLGFGIQTGGVWMVQSPTGSNFEYLGRNKYDEEGNLIVGLREVQIKSINSISLHSLNDFNHVMTTIKPGDDILINVCDLRGSYRGSSCQYLRIDSFDDDIELNTYSWNPASLDWELEK